jgi:hypothetical protein
LARKDDVSDSPGFKSCGLIFDKTVSWLLNMLIRAQKDMTSWSESKFMKDWKQNVVLQWLIVAWPPQNHSIEHWPLWW